VAQEATARQSGVDDKSVKLTAKEGATGSYQPGTITFAARKGKSIDLAKLRADIQATRLGKRTSSAVTYLEITATGTVVEAGKELKLTVSGTKDQFLLGEDPQAKPAKGEKTALSRLREAVTKGEKVTGVTGRVEGWSGKWPDVLKALEAEEKKAPGKRKPSRLFVTGFEVAKR